MKKMPPILLTLVLLIFFIYGLAFAVDHTGSLKLNDHSKSENKSTHHIQQTTYNNISPNTPSRENKVYIKKSIDLNFFKTHLVEGVTQADIIKLFGENYRESLSEQSGEPTWTYDFPKNPTYVPQVPPFTVDEKGILTGKMKFQLNVVWNGEQIKSYIVFYNDNGSVGEMKGKFFEGPYINE